MLVTKYDLQFENVLINVYPTIDSFKNTCHPKEEFGSAPVNSFLEYTTSVNFSNGRGKPRQNVRLLHQMKYQKESTLKRIHNTLMTKIPKIFYAVFVMMTVIPTPLHNKTLECGTMQCQIMWMLVNLFRIYCTPGHIQVISCKHYTTIPSIPWHVQIESFILTVWTEVHCD